MKRMIFTIIQGIGMAVVLSLLSMWIGEQFFSTYLPRLPEARHGISISAATFSIVLAPIIEEYLIRVKLLPFLIRRTNLPAAVFFSSFIFSVLHGQVFLLPYFLNSLVYSWVSLKTKKAYGSMIVHSTYNFIALLPSI